MNARGQPWVSAFPSKLVIPMVQSTPLRREKEMGLNNNTFSNLTLQNEQLTTNVSCEHCFFQLSQFLGGDHCVMPEPSPQH